MPRAGKVCSRPGCPEIVPAGQGRCNGCARLAEQARGTAVQRGYGKAHRAFRRAVLRRDPVCVVCRIVTAEHADHWPMSLRELQDLGLNPYTPDRGRGLCGPCHSRATAEHQPGGWNAP